MTFLEKITSSDFEARLSDLRGNRPEIETLGYMLGDRLKEWAHSCGVATEDQLKAVSPPVPPHELRSIVAAPSEAVFLWTGIVDAMNFMATYKSHSENVNPRILDFGCGCGRMTRFLGLDRDLSVYGCDINDQLVEWCSANLPDVTTVKNGSMPPIPFEDETFDLVYSLSIFTHLPEEAALAWLTELNRVLAEDGIAILTTHGYPAMDTIAESEIHQQMFRLTSEAARNMRDRLEQEGFQYLRYDADVITAANAGDDYGNSFTHEGYIRSKWSEAGFDVVEFTPGGMRGWQDLTVLRKRKDMKKPSSKSGAQSGAKAKGSAKTKQSKPVKTTPPSSPPSPELDSRSQLLAEGNDQANQSVGKSWWKRLLSSRT